MTSIRRAAASIALAIAASGSLAGRAEAQQSYESIRQAYQPYARAATDYVTPIVIEAARDDREKGPEDPVMLGGCVVPLPYDAGHAGSPADRLDRDLTHLAIEMAWMRERLRRLGYPPELYRRLLISHEAEELRSIAARQSGNVADDDEQDVVEAIERRRARSFRYLRPVESVGCPPPPGQYRAILRSAPAGRPVYYIREFDWLLCFRQGTEPWNVRSCTRWAQSDAQQALPFYGWYRVQVRWPNGNLTQTRKRIDGAVANGGQYPAYTVSR